MSWPSLLSGMRRYAWAGVVLWLIVAIGSAVGYLRTPPQYVATQSVDIALLPVGQVTAASQQRLDAQAATIARTMASPGFLVSAPFTTAVRQQLAGVIGSHELVDVTPEQIGAALSATNTGTQVTISARAGSRTRSEQLAQAAIQALAQHAAELLPRVPDATTRIIPGATPPHAARDSTSDEAARDLLLARLGLATATALLVVIILGWLGGSTSRRNGGLSEARASEGVEQAEA